MISVIILLMKEMTTNPNVDSSVLYKGFLMYTIIV